MIKFHKAFLIILFLIFNIFHNPLKAQLSYKQSALDPLNLKQPSFKLYTRSYGAIVGVQRGKFTFFEFGVEKHWSKVKLVHQRTYSLGANFEYNFKHNVVGYKISGWTKVGRINLTYGFNLCYFTDFHGSRYGAGPAIGFRLLGFHLINGYNFMAGTKEFQEFNKLYITIRYYFPLEKKLKFKKKNKN